MRETFSDVYSCALQRWAAFANSKKPDDQRRANDEKETAFMALTLASKPPVLP